MNETTIYETAVYQIVTHLNSLVCTKCVRVYGVLIYNERDNHLWNSRVPDSNSSKQFGVYKVCTSV